MLFNGYADILDPAAFTAGVAVSALDLPPVDDSEVTRLEVQLQEVRQALANAEVAGSDAMRRLSDTFREGASPVEAERDIEDAESRAKCLRRRADVIGPLLQAARADLRSRKAQAEKDGRAALLRRLELARAAEKPTMAFITRSSGDRRGSPIPDWAALSAWFRRLPQTHFPALSPLVSGRESRDTVKLTAQLREALRDYVVPQPALQSGWALLRLLEEGHPDETLTLAE